MWSIVANVASLFGIAGVSFTSLISDPWKLWITFAIFVALAAYGGWTIYRVGNAAIHRRYPKGYLPLSSAARFTTADGAIATYEAFRHIQIKKPVMTYFDHKFFWSGSKEPSMESDIQKCSQVRAIENDRRKSVRLTFPRARIYNDVEIIHLKMTLDDADGKAEPFISMRVDEPIRLISFRVELLHQNGRYQGQHATVSRALIKQGNSAIDETIAHVQFDANTRSFAFQSVEPEPGYTYKITWPRNAPTAKRQKKAEPSWK